MMKKPFSFQKIILQLSTFWESAGCVLHSGHDIEMGAGTFHPVTFLRCLGPEPYDSAYVQPSRRPQDGRFGENPNRLHLFHQYQVIKKPAPHDILKLYLDSLEQIGIDRSSHDIRFVHDDWESPTLGAWGLGWEVWCDGMEITQITYFQGMGSQILEVPSVEITYGLERIAMFVQNVDNIFKVAWNDQLTLGDIALQSEQEWCAHNFSHASLELWHRHFRDFFEEASRLCAAHLSLPAFDMVLKASHAFNILDARGVISATERVRYIDEIRTLARLVAQEYLISRQKQGFGLLKGVSTAPAIKKIANVLPTHNKERSTFLLEIGCEPLPSSFIPIGAKALEQGFAQWLHKEGIPYERLEIYATPQRLAIKIIGLLNQIPSITTEKKGPAVERAFLPDGALSEQGIGFLRSLGVEEMFTQEDLDNRPSDSALFIKKEGAHRYLCGNKISPPKATALCLQEQLPSLLRAIQFPKMMRWNQESYSFARPIRWLLSLLDEEELCFSFADVSSGRMTKGHLQHSDHPLILSHADHYEAILESYKVMPSAKKREKVIRDALNSMTIVDNLTIVAQETVLKEAIYLAEWPELCYGSFQKRFLSLPKEIAICEMIEHQRYFPLLKDNQLHYQFLIVCDNHPNSTIREGNEKVLTARLSDGAFLFEKDKKRTLKDLGQQLETLLFHPSCGSFAKKQNRVETLAQALAPPSIDSQTIATVAQRLKADLVSATVQEFPALQGIIGRELALHEGLPSVVAQAIEEHWYPKTEQSPLPETTLGALFALCDRLDTLLCFWLAKQAPSSSQDPYALRRQALGLLKIMLQYPDLFPMDLESLIEIWFSHHGQKDTDVASSLLLFLKERLVGLFRHFPAAMVQNVIFNPARGCSPTRSHAWLKTKTTIDKMASEALGQTMQRLKRFYIEGVLEKQPHELYKLWEELHPKITHAFEEQKGELMVQLLTQYVEPVEAFFASVLIEDPNKEKTMQNKLLLSKIYQDFLLF